MEIRILGLKSLGPLLALVLATAACGHQGSGTSRLQSATPLNEKATYILAAARSSPQVKRGTVTLTVTGQSADSYTVEVNYSLVLHMLFWDQPYSGTSKLNVPAAYFTPDFWDNLAAHGTFASGDLSAKYLGTVDAQADGETYGGAYKVGLSTASSIPASLKRPVVEAAVKPGLPVLGVVNVDISATLNDSLPLKAGFDLSHAVSQDKGETSL